MVTIRARLEAAGRVRDARVLSRPELLRSAALLYVLDWQYAAGKSTQRIVDIAIDCNSGCRRGFQSNSAIMFQKHQSRGSCKWSGTFMVRDTEVKECGFSFFMA